MKKPEPTVADQRFATRLKTGARFEDVVAQRIAEQGFAVQRPVVTQNFTKTQKDIVVGGHVLEVKSRKLDFTGPEDFPYKDIIVDGSWGLDRKDQQPALYVFISQTTGAIIVIDVLCTKTQWTKRKQFDPHYRQEYWAYYATKDLLKDEAYLYRWLEKNVIKP